MREEEGGSRISEVGFKASSLEEVGVAGNSEVRTGSILRNSGEAHYDPVEDSMCGSRDRLD